MKQNLAFYIKRTPAIAWVIIIIALMVIPLIAWQVLGRNNQNDLSSYTYLYGIAHTGIVSNDPGITKSTIPNLKLVWKKDTGSAVSMQPIIYNQVLYWGGWDGNFHASDLKGNDMWKVNLGSTTVVDCPAPNSVGLASSPSLADISIGGSNKQVIFVGGGAGAFYAIDTSNGKILWKNQLGTPPNEFIWSSPTLYNGKVYIGMSSFGDCPLVAGKLFELDQSTGKVLNTFVTVPTGCIGATVWSTPTIDSKNNTVYISTGNSGECPQPEKYGYSLVELDAGTLKPISYWSTPTSDQDIDSDFGASPTLFTSSINGNNEDLVGLVNKNGIYYAFQRGNLAAGPVWQDQIAQSGDCVECGNGSISTSAWDGKYIYVGGGSTTINGSNCLGSVRALSPADGTIAWSYCDAADPVMAGLLVDNDMVIVPVGGSIVFLDKSNGDVISKQTPQAVSSMFAAPPAISSNFLLFPNLDGTLFAYGL